MGKTEKFLLFTAVLLTVILAAFWFVNFTYQADSGSNSNSSKSPKQNLDSRLDIDGEPGTIFEQTVNIIENFRVQFSNVTENTVSIGLDGDTLNVRAVELVIAYDPEKISITSTENGEVFDLFISQGNIAKDEDGKEIGIVKMPLAFSLADIPLLEEGTIGVLSFNKLSEEPATLTILQYSDKDSDYSQVILDNEDKYTVEEVSIQI